jgi:hypothetical protein
MLTPVSSRRLAFSIWLAAGTVAFGSHAAAEDPEPTAAELAAAPPPHQASGRLRDHDRDEGALRRAGRAVLWGPRQLLELGLWAPDALAGRTDDYLESRGPNVFARGEDSGGWSGSALLAWEQPFGPSVGARVGHTIGRHVSADVGAVAFGRYGFTGRLGLNVEPRVDGPVRIDVDAEYAHGRETAFAGVGDHALGDGDAAVPIDPYARSAAPEVIADDRALSFKAAVPIDLGPLELRPSARFERHDVGADDDDAFAAYDTGALAGFGDPFAVGVGGVELVYDDRHAPYPWIPEGAPATGWLARASGSYTGGDARFARYGASVERLIDLFRGTRVLILRARLEAVTGERDEVPFVLLPSLGGPDAMRAFSRGRFRDAAATSAEAAYEWAVGLHSRAALFIEEGGVHPGIDHLDGDRLHMSAGGWYRLAFDRGTVARAVLAGSDTGELGFFIIVGGV